MRRTLLAIAALALLLAPATASANPDASVEVRIAQGVWHTDPCATQRIVVLWQTGLEDHGLAATATGISRSSDGTWTLRACEITVDPVWWQHTPAYIRCLVVVHEVGHLGSRGHSPPGTDVMSAEPGVHPDCEHRKPLVDRIGEALFVLHPDGFISCDAWQGRVLPCDVLDYSIRNDPICYRARTRRVSPTLVLFHVQRVKLRHGLCHRPRPGARR